MIRHIPPGTSKETIAKAEAAYYRARAKNDNLNLPQLVERIYLEENSSHAFIDNISPNNPGYYRRRWNLQPIGNKTLIMATAHEKGMESLDGYKIINEGNSGRFSYQARDSYHGAYSVNPKTFIYNIPSGLKTIGHAKILSMIVSFHWDMNMANVDQARFYIDDVLKYDTGMVLGLGTAGPYDMGAGSRVVKIIVQPGSDPGTLWDVSFEAECLVTLNEPAVYNKTGQDYLTTWLPGNGLVN